MYIAISLIAVAGLLFCFFTAKRVRRDNRRKKLSACAFPDEWRQIAEKNVPVYNHLPEPMKRELEGLVQIFLAEKKFEGCGGLEINDQIRVTIAVQACILLLNRKTSYFRKLKTILVYPATYAAKSVQMSGGIEVEGQSVRLGESWQNGPVVLAWDSVTGGARNMADGRNVVMHEFSHQLDQESGAADGAPILESRSSYSAWALILGEEYATLQQKTRKHQRSVLNRYGATNPAEFFAVATETFFEKAKQMKKKHPELYEELKEYYKLDPVEWE